MQRTALLALSGAAFLLWAGTAAAAGDITQGNEMNGLLRMLYGAAKARRSARRVEIHGESWIDGEGWLLSRGSGEGRASVWMPLTWAMDVENVGAWCR